MTKEQMVWNWLEDVQHQIFYEMNQINANFEKIPMLEWQAGKAHVDKLLGERRAYQKMLVKIFSVDNAEIKNKMEEISKKYM